METQLASRMEVAKEQAATNRGLWIPRLLVAGALMAVAGNCFLKYLWWAANYSAWQGIPKYAAQWQAAGARTSFYGWSLVVLEIASVVIIFGVVQLRSLDSSRPLRSALRIIASLVLTILGTGLFALLLSWIKQATP